MAEEYWHKTAAATLRALGDSTIWIADLYSRNSTQEHTTELLEKLVSEADQRDIALQVDARSCKLPLSMSVGEFILFYEGFDFEHVPMVGKYLMERLPKASQEKQAL